MNILRRLGFSSPKMTLHGLNSKHLKKGDSEPAAPAAGKYRLYNMRFCPFAERTVLYLARKGIECEIVNINLIEKPEWYFKIHPQGKVPALEHDGKVVLESALIPQYLDDLYPNTTVLPKEAYPRVQQKVMVEQLSGCSDSVFRSMLTPETVSNLTYALCGAGVFSNILLLYTILTKTPASLRSFSIMILNACLTDCAQCLVEIFTVTRVASIGRSIILIPQGVCNYFGKQACLAGFVMTMTLLCSMFYANTACFVFRYIILTKGSVKVRSAILACVALLIPSMCVFIAAEIEINSSSTEYLANVTRDLPHKEGYVMFGVVDYLTFLPQFYLFLSIFSSPFHYAVIIYMRKKVLHMLDSNEHISAKTKRSHMQLMKAITLQACLPPILILDITLYGLMQADYIHWPFLEQIALLWPVVCCAIAPFIHLYFIRPYREAALAMFGLRSNRKNIVTDTNNTQRATVTKE